MKQIGSNFKNNIIKYGRQIDTIIEFEDIKLTKEDINSVIPSFNTSLFKSVMQSLEIDSNVKIPVNTHINVKIGVKFQGGTYEYIEYKDYKVRSCESQEDTESYKIVAYDKMIDSMVDYDLMVVYPITVRDYLISIFETLGWNTENIPASFVNSSVIIQNDVHTQIDYTYRDVLDEIATITGSFICVVNGEPTIKYITDTQETIDEEYLSPENVTVGEKYFINSLVFSRAEESDNIYRKDDANVEEYGLHELRISNNQILSTSDRDSFIDELWEYIKTLNFYIYDVKSTGIMFLEVADMFIIKVHGNNYNVVLLNDDITIDQDIEEYIYMEYPAETETDYKCATESDKRLRRVEILANKQEGKINLAVELSEEASAKAAELELTSSEISSRVSETETLLVKDYMTKEEAATQYSQLSDSFKFNINNTIEELKEEGASKVMTTSVTVDDEGVTVGKSDSGFTNTMNNTGTYQYNAGELIAKYDKDGAEIPRLKSDYAVISDLKYVKEIIDGVVHHRTYVLE